MKNDILVIIPSRLGSTRLLEKPLKTIGNKTMIEHLCDSVKKSGIENFFVATDSDKIKNLLEKKSVKVIMTDSNLNSGTDRVYHAWKKIDPNKEFKYIINIQGDMPFIDPKIISDICNKITKTNFDILTPVTKVNIDIAKSNSNVKAVISKNNKALYFSRSLIPSGANEFLYHVGVYAFKANALESFVMLPKSKYESEENLEQLRAIENDISIGVIFCDSIPISVDTSEDLEKAIIYYENISHGL